MNTDNIESRLVRFEYPLNEEGFKSEVSSIKSKY